MNRISIAALVLLVTPGYTEDKGLVAEQRYEMVARHGTPEERCTAMTEVANTYLELREEEKYKDWHLRASSYCFNVEASRRIGVEPL